MVMWQSLPFACTRSDDAGCFTLLTEIVCHAIFHLSKAKSWQWITSRYRQFCARATLEQIRTAGYAAGADGELCMPDQDQAELRLSVARLRQEHEDYDVAINAMIQTGCDALRVQRMKKKKLIIKDKIMKIEDQIIPDIIA